MTMKPLPPSVRTILALVAAAFLAAGCATKSTGGAKKQFIFFPPAPDEPRLQFLVSYSSEQELRGGSGGFSTFVTGERQAKNPILKPYGLALHQNQLYVCDTALNAVLMLDLQKRHAIALAPSGQWGFKGSLNLAVDHDGSPYVVDTVRNQILIFDARGRFQAAV